MTGTVPGERASEPRQRRHPRGVHLVGGRPAAGVTTSSPSTVGSSCRSRSCVGLDCLLDPTSGDICNVGGDDTTAAGAQPIGNSSGLSLAQVLEDPSVTHSRLRAYIDGFRSEVESVFVGFSFFDEVDRPPTNSAT